MRSLFIRRAAIHRRGTIYAICTNFHTFCAKTLLLLPIDKIPLLWYNIDTVKERNNTYYD